MRRYALLLAAALCLGIVTMDNDAVLVRDCVLGIRATKSAGRSVEEVTCRAFDVPMYESGKEAMLH